MLTASHQPPSHQLELISTTAWWSPLSPSCHRTPLPNAAIVVGLRGGSCHFPSPLEPPLDPSLHPPLEHHRHRLPHALPTTMAITNLPDPSLLAIPSTTMILLEMPRCCPISLLQAPKPNSPSSRSSPVLTTIQVAAMLPPCSPPSSHSPPIAVPLSPYSQPSHITIGLIHRYLHCRPDPFESPSRAVTSSSPQSSPLHSQASRHMTLATHCSLHLLPIDPRSLKEPTTTILSRWLPMPTTSRPLSYGHGHRQATFLILPSKSYRELSPPSPHLPCSALHHVCPPRHPASHHYWLHYPLSAQSMAIHPM